MTTTNSESSSNTAVNPIKSKNNADLIRALTPITIAFIGGMVGLYAIHQVQGQELTAAMGLAGTAMAGASGLTQQSSKNG